MKLVNTKPFRIVLLVIVSLFISVLGATSSAHAAPLPIPQLTQPVVDPDHLLSPSDFQTLNKRLRSFADSKGSQIVLYVFKTRGEEAIEQLGIRVAETWKVGRKGSSDGVLILLALDDREVRIEVGQGFEGALTDVTSKRIIEDIMIPHFKDNDVFGGLSAGIDAVIKVISGESLPPPPRHHSGGGGGGSSNPIPMAFWIGLVVAFILAQPLGHPLGSTLGALVTFFIGLISMSLIGAAVTAVILWIFMFFGGSGLIGFSGGGFSSSGGGFSGGGGSFSGGGASGKW